MASFNPPWHGLPSADGPVCKLTALNPSTLFLRDELVIDPPIEHGSRRPVLAFLIEHNQLDKRILFDLSLFENWRDWLGEQAGGYDAEFKVEIAKEGNLVDQLRRINIEPEQIDVVILSHKHFDHTGQPSAFKNAQIWIHNDEKDAVPALKSVSADAIKPFTFDTTETKPIASFDHSLDMFGDGSIVIVSVPGHTPGHVGAMVRTGEDDFIILGADGCHHRLLLNGTKEDEKQYKLGRAKDEPMYEDYDVATRSLDRLRRARAEPNVLVLTAHDESQWGAWVKTEGKSVIELNGWRERGLKEM
ncbi:hypothetical protein OIO90_004701 [Microbotryomycetes sp. JL221]|nr:hypothetical protein OIO90_004701 [Microbotryomycetes sp. JL221]